MLPLVDEHGIVIGQARRSWCHLHILNRAGDLYLQKRSMTKDLLPGYWDTAVGGHVDYGEQIEEALLREAGEELGFYDFNPIYLGTYVFESKREKELVNVFATVGSFTLHPDGSEVTEGRFWSFAEIDAAMGKKTLTPNFEGEFKQFRSALQALL